MFACAYHVAYGNEHTISREVQGCCAGGRAIQIHTSWRYQNRPFSYGYNTSSGTAAVQQHQRFKLWPSWRPRCSCALMCVKYSRDGRTCTHNHDHIYLHVQFGNQTHVVHAHASIQHTEVPGVHEKSQMMLPLFQICGTLGVSSQPRPEGEPRTCYQVCFLMIYLYRYKRQNRRASCAFFFLSVWLRRAKAVDGDLGMYKYFTHNTSFVRSSLLSLLSLLAPVGWGPPPSRTPPHT